MAPADGCQRSTITLEMTTLEGFYFSDSFVLSFNMRFYRTLKVT